MAMKGPAWARCKAKVDCGQWPTATEYRAYMEEKGCSPAEARARTLAYAREPEFDIRAVDAADDFLATLKSFALPTG